MRLQVPVTRGVAGVDARRVDDQLDLGAVQADGVRAVEAIEPAADGVEAPEVLDLELDRRLTAVDRPALHRRVPALECGTAHRVSFVSWDPAERGCGCCHPAASRRTSAARLGGSRL